MFEFDSDDEAQNVIPVLSDQFSVNVSVRENFVAQLFIDLALLERVKTLLVQVLDAWRKGEPKQVRYAKDDFSVYVDN